MTYKYGKEKFHYKHVLLFHFINELLITYRMPHEDITFMISPTGMKIIKLYLYYTIRRVKDYQYSLFNSINMLW